jgi:hypothetical protein
MISFNGKVTIEPGGSVWVAGTCYEITLDGIGWSYAGSAPYTVRLYDAAKDIPFVSPNIPSWYYSSSGASIKSMYCQKRPSRDSSGDRNQALILFVANDDTVAQWQYGYFQFDQSSSILSFTPEHYSNPAIRYTQLGIAGTASDPWMWSYDGGQTKIQMLQADINAFFNPCPKGAGYLLAPGDGIFYSLTIT